MSQQRHHRLIHQRSTPVSIGRTKFQTPRQSEETMLRQVKPLLQRGMGFGGTTISCETGGSSYRLETGTRESSLGKVSSNPFVSERDIMLITPSPDSDNAYSTYPLIIKDKENRKDESSSSTLKASNDQIDKHNNPNYGGAAT